MKNKICIFAVFTIVFVSLFNINCSKSGGGDDFFIPIIGAATWHSTSNLSENDTFFFFNETPNTNTSTFEGNEHISDSTFHFTGSFTNHNIQFTYDTDTSYHARSGKTYSGTINDESTEMTLHSAGLPDLTLEKQ